MIDPTHAAWLPLLAPLPALLALLLPRRWANANADLTSLLCRTLLFASLALAVAATGALALAGAPLHREFLAFGPAGLTIYFDAVSAVMLLLVAFLGVAVTIYSRHYLAGDAGQGRFQKWLAGTAGCVLLLVVSGNLALFTVAWMATSLSLHKLLVFYPDRPAAVTAAWKKFVFSRLGDVCLLAALAMAWGAFGTLDYAALFAEAKEVNGSEQVSAVAFLLVASAILKSAQLPFHGWLPDTMETPTPVSALMHAGIINAGGFLVIRFSPLVALSPSALGLLALVGGLTALFASLVMITQTSIKRSLAFSTVAQMGFMMLQCGLGAFALALFHIVAHSLYKAHAFLSSGSIIAVRRAAGASAPRTYRGLGGVAAAFASSVAVVVAVFVLAGKAPWQNPAEFALALILVLALAQMLWNWWATATSPGWVAIGVGIATAIAGISLALHHGTEVLLGDALAAAPDSMVIWPIAILTPLAFLLIAARAFLPPGWVSTRLGQALFVHAYNGFYVNTLANRLLHALRGSSTPAGQA